MSISPPSTRHLTELDTRVFAESCHSLRMKRTRAKWQQGINVDDEEHESGTPSCKDSGSKAPSTRSFAPGTSSVCRACTPLARICRSHLHSTWLATSRAPEGLSLRGNNTTAYGRTRRGWWFPANVSRCCDQDLQGYLPVMTKRRYGSDLPSKQDLVLCGAFFQTTSTQSYKLRKDIAGSAALRCERALHLWMGPGGE